MDSLLGGLFGGQGNDDERRAQAQDFVDRVESGNPTEGFSTEEALTSYSQVADRLSPNELEEAATEALQRFSPEQRREFSQMLQQQTGASAGATDDPREIAHLTSQLQSQSPDGLIGLLGGGGLDSILGGLTGGGGQSSGGGGLLDGLLGGLLGGGDDRDPTPSRSAAGSQQGGLGDLLGNPIAQAILAAIAAIAMKKFMGRDDSPAAPAPGGGGSGGSGGGGLTGGGWQPKEAGHRAQDTKPAQDRQPAKGGQPGGGWKPKTASHTEGDNKPEGDSGLKGADAKDA